VIDGPYTFSIAVSHSFLLRAWCECCICLIPTFPSQTKHKLS
jgi:hypothetical protein